MPHRCCSAARRHFSFTRSFCWLFVHRRGRPARQGDPFLGWVDGRLRHRDWPQRLHAASTWGGQTAQVKVFRSPPLASEPPCLFSIPKTRSSLARPRCVEAQDENGNDDRPPSPAPIHELAFPAPIACLGGRDPPTSGADRVRCAAPPRKERERCERAGIWTEMR